MTPGIRLESIACELCGSDVLKPVFTTRDYNWGFDGEFTMVECASCGLKFINPRPVQDDIWQFYAQSFMATAPGFGPEDMRRAAMAVAPLLKLKQSGKVLDIGCNTGRLLFYLKKQGWDVHGVEPRAEAAAAAIENLGPVVFNGRVEDAGFDHATFDAITMLHVLEHIYHPLEMLRSIRPFLKPGGVLMAETPNIDSAEAKVFGARWSAVDAPRHVFHFSPRTLRAVAEKAGFTNTAITHLPEIKGKIMSGSESLRHLLSDRGVKKQAGKSATPAVTPDTHPAGRGNPLKMLLHNGESTAFDAAGRAAASLGMGARIVLTAVNPG